MAYYGIIYMTTYNYKTRGKKLLMRIIIRLILTTLLLTGSCFSSTIVHANSFFDFFRKTPTAHTPAKYITKTVDQAKAPTHVKVGVYVLNISKYDPQRATIHMDFYLLFNCKPTCGAMNFEIINANSPNIQLIEKRKDYLAYRVQTELNKADNLRNYPFDSHRIDIILEDKHMTIDKLIFERNDNTTEIDSNLNVVGFHLISTWTANITNHFYGVFKRTFSSYKFSLHLVRPVIAGFLKGILPALIIACCAFLALFMKTEHISQRFSITTSALIASVVFHLSLTSSLPALGYVTYADMFMLVNYMCLFIILIEVVFTTYCLDTQYRDLGICISNLSSRIVPSGWLILQVMVWFIFNPIRVIQ
jgi:hypothetical protein